MKATPAHAVGEDNGRCHTVAGSRKELAGLSLLSFKVCALSTSGYVCTGCTMVQHGCAMQ